MPESLANLDMAIITPLVALIFGLLILFVPRLLNFLVAIYLIFVGVIGLWPHLFPPAVGSLAARIRTTARRRVWRAWGFAPARCALAPCGRR